MGTGSTKSSQSGQNILGIIFTTVGIALWCVMNYAMLLPGLDATTWSLTTCDIQGAWVNTHPGEDSDTYSIGVKYSYTDKNGQPHTGNRYRFDIGSSSGKGRKQRIVDDLKAKGSVPCFYDPVHPQQSVIYRTLTWEYLWGLFPLIFVFIGMGVMWSGRTK